MEGTARESLELILDRYYRVQGKSFSESSPVQVWKHQVLHLAKLTKKLLLFVLGPTEETRSTVCREVLPDLLIYAQELILKSDTEPSVFFLSTLEHEECYETIQQALLATSVGVAALADICDQTDHQQPSEFLVDRDVIPPFLRTAATLRTLLDVDLADVYNRRLEAMREKYEGWYRPRQRTPLSE